MGEAFNVKIEGFKELADELRELPKALSRKHLRYATSKAAAVVRDDAKIRARPPIPPVGGGPKTDSTGVLARSIYQYFSREESDAEHCTFHVSARRGVKARKQKRDAYYAGFVEFGHFSRPAAAGGTARQVWVPAHPFLRPAFDNNYERAIEVLGQQLAIGLLDETAKSGLIQGK